VYYSSHSCCVSSSIVGADAERVSAGARSVNVDAGVRHADAPAPPQCSVPTAVVQSAKPVLQRQPRSTGQVHRQLPTADVHNRRMTSALTTDLLWNWPLGLVIRSPVQYPAFRGTGCNRTKGLLNFGAMIYCVVVQLMPVIFSVRYTFTWAYHIIRNSCLFPICTKIINFRLFYHFQIAVLKCEILVYLTTM